MTDDTKVSGTERVVAAVRDLVARAMTALRSDFSKQLDEHTAQVAKLLEEQDRRIERHAAHLARHETRIQKCERTKP